MVILVGNIQVRSTENSEVYLKCTDVQREARDLRPFLLCALRLMQIVYRKGQSLNIENKSSHFQCSAAAISGRE